MQQAIQDALNAGFSQSSAQIIAAIAMAESSLNPSAEHTNTDGSVDRGILQINSHWHAEVPNTCAYDTACSFQQAYRISSNGTDFSPWATYQSGAYQQYLSNNVGAWNPGNQQLMTTNAINPVSPVTDAISGIQQILSIVGLFSLQNIKTALYKTGLFIVAAILIVVGFIIIAKQPNGGNIDLSDITSIAAKGKSAPVE